MMRIIIVCLCTGLAAGKTLKPFDTDLHWSDVSLNYFYYPPLNIHKVGAARGALSGVTL